MYAVIEVQVNVIAPKPELLKLSDRTWAFDDEAVAVIAVTVASQSRELGFDSRQRTSFESGALAGEDIRNALQIVNSVMWPQYFNHEYHSPRRKPVIDHAAFSVMYSEDSEVDHPVSRSGTRQRVMRGDQGLQFTYINVLHLAMVSEKYITFYHM